MRRRALWIGVGFVTLAAGGYAAVGAVLGSRYEERIAAFRASEVCAELVRCQQEAPAEDNAVVLLAEAREIYERIRSEQGVYFSFWVDPNDEFDREEAAKALEAMAPFLDAVARATERPVAQYPAFGPATQARDEARCMLLCRARLEPGRSAETADDLLRLVARWRPRSSVDFLMRGVSLCQALGVVRQALAQDREHANRRLAAWRQVLGVEDPLGDFRAGSTAAKAEEIDAVAAILRGEDPFAEARQTFRRVRGTLKEVDDDGELTRRLDEFAALTRTPWCFAWYGRPVLYGRLIEEHDRWWPVMEKARTESDLRALLRGEQGSPLKARCLRTLEHLAAVRVAMVALAVAAGEATPQLEDPFTGLPLSVRQQDGTTIVAAAAPLEFPLIQPDLLSWEVSR